MPDVDDTDLEILRLLLADARRPYSGIAERVGLSGPAVSDRVDRLREMGVVRRFTVDVDRSTLRDGVRVLVAFALEHDARTAVRDRLADVSGVEHLLETADGDLLVVATVPDGDVLDHFAPVVDDGGVRDVDVTLLADAEWVPDLGDATLGLTCAECGNTVTSEGETAVLGGDRYEFCCRSCESRFRETYERLEDGA